MEFNIEVIPTAPQDTRVETPAIFHARTVHVHPKVISGQTSATLGFQGDQRRLPDARGPVAAVLLLRQRPQFTAALTRDPLRYWIRKRVRHGTLFG